MAYVAETPTDTNSWDRTLENTDRDTQKPSYNQLLDVPHLKGNLSLWQPRQMEVIPEIIRFKI